MSKSHEKSEPQKLVQCRVSRHVAKKLETLARETKRSRSAMISIFLEKGVNNPETLADLEMSANKALRC